MKSFGLGVVLTAIVWSVMFLPEVGGLILATIVVGIYAIGFWQAGRDHWQERQALKRHAAKVRLTSS